MTERDVRDDLFSLGLTAPEVAALRHIAEGDVAQALRHWVALPRYACFTPDPANPERQAAALLLGRLSALEQKTPHPALARLQALVVAYMAQQG